MILEMKVPSPGESITEVEIAEWLVQDGDYVEKDQAIAEVDSDKATLELPAEANGTITLQAEVGDAIAVGSVVCLIDTKAEKPAVDAAQVAKETKVVQSTPTESVENYASGSPSPAAKKIIDEKGIDKATITGSGRNGRITKEDAIQAVPSMGTPTGDRPVTRKKMSLLRRKVAERLVAAKNETAMLTTFNEVDLTNVMALRKQVQEQFVEKYGIKLGFMSLFAKACAKALMEMPDVNAMLDGNELVYHDYVDISIAISTPTGLVVPPVNNVESLKFHEIETKIKELAGKAREGSLTLDEMRGGTFTITNGGVFGSMMSTPIINEPQSAILGMHTIQQRPMAIDGEVKTRPMMYLALSYDHRVIDGALGAELLQSISKYLGDPVLMLT